MTNNKKKIYFVIKSLTLKGGGAERVFVNLVNNLFPNFKFLQIITFDKDIKNTFYPLDKNIKYNNIFSNEVSKTTSLFSFILKIVKIRKFLIENDNSIYVCFMSSTFLLFALANFRLNNKIIASEHMIYNYYRENIFQLILFKLLFFKLDEIITVSKQAKNTFPKYMQKKIKIINNPVQIKHKIIKQKLNNEKTLLNIGRMENQKDHLTLIKIFHQVRKKNKEVKLIIIGNGSMKNQIMNLIKHLNLSNYVTILDFQSEISKFYYKSYLYVSTSKFESHGLTISEALNHKLPCLAFRSCEGINTLIKDNINGFLVDDDKNKITNFADKINYCLENRSTIEKMSDKITNINNDYKIYEEWQNLIKYQ